MMDAHELATNAEQNYWPPHLGVTTDAEKIEYLAQRLRQYADDYDRAEALQDELAEAQKQVEFLQSELDDRQARLDKIRNAL